MNINIYTNISGELNDDEIKVTINASKSSNILNKIIENIQSISNNIDTIIGIKDNEIYIINIYNIIKFYSKDQNNYCATTEGEFRIKKRLYELEEILDKDNFIRISNSCIVNVKFIKNFDLTLIGNITVNFKNGSVENVSKRRIPRVIKFLKERGN